MNKSEVLPAIVWAIIGATICLASAALRLGSWRHPQPGLFPFLIGSGIVLLSVIHALAHIVATSEPEIPPSSGSVGRLGVVFAALSVYALALERVGFLVCALVFFVAVFKTLSRKSWAYSILAALIATVLSYLMFETWLKVNLPPGPLGI